MKSVPNKALDYTDNDFYDFYYFEDEPFTGISFFEGKRG